MNKKLNNALYLCLTALVLVGCKGGDNSSSNGISTIGENHLYSDYFSTGTKYKNTYNAFQTEAIKKELNYLKYNDGALAKHWANFVDGLLLQNEYGVLEKQLATSAKQVDQKIFTFEVKENIPWMLYDGKTQYEAMVNGVKTAQYVSAQDFVTSAEAVLNYANQSQLTYLYTNFVQGAIEYNKFTYIVYQIDNGPAFWKTQCGNTRGFTKKLNELIKAETGKPSNVPATDAALKAIRDFENVGVKATGVKSNGGGTIEYTLNDKAFYFPTLLAYSCYLPVNEHFLDAVSFGSFGKEKDKLLYCGPFTLYESTDKKIVYKKNTKYHDLDTVLLDTVNYRVFGSAEAPDTARKEFEAGNIDSFGLTTRDRQGWMTYIEGPDKKNPGTLENPYSPVVNSREYDYIDYVYGLQINVNRVASESKGQTASKSYANNSNEKISGSLEQIQNAEKALRIQEVRKLVIEAFDVIENNEKYALDGSRPGQYTISTFVPKNFVQDENAQDYTQTHYYKAYADWYQEDTGKELTYTDKNGTKTGVEAAAEYLKQGVTARNYVGAQDDINVLRDKAIAAIEKYNESEDAKVEGKIEFPVQLEMFSEWQNSNVRGQDIKLIKSMNQRLNNDSETLDFNRDNTKLSQDKTKGGFLIIPTYEVKEETNRDSVTNNGNWDLAAAWGWGPDYGDPMSYMNTYTIKGDWSNILGFVGDDYTPNYHVDKESGKLVKTNLLEEYTNLVNDADATTNVTSKRYEKFAKAECMLLNELSVFKPLTMTGQGRQASVSRAAGYHNPQGSYGLAKDRNDGLIVLTDPITAEQRKTSKEKFDALKLDYLNRYGSMNIY